jgi:cell wall-associated NlpC family hydrolase
MKTRLCILFVVVSILPSIVSSQPSRKPDSPVAAALDSLKARYAPDDRVAIFQVSCIQQGSVNIARGEVDNPAAKSDALSTIRRILHSEVVDSIKVLPDPQFGDKQFGIVAVSVGNVRTSPRHPGAMATQAMMGMVARLFKQQGGWYYIQLPDRYMGWLESNAMKITNETGVEAWKAASKAIVTTYFTMVREEPNANAQPLRDAVAGNLMKQLGEKGSWVHVELPDGATGYIERSSVEDYASWKQSRHLTVENIEKTAKTFLGVPYLWGGTSPKGMDCSGFTKMVYRLNGLELSRDASQQAQEGDDIEPGENFQNLKKGDLVFFGRKGSPERPEQVSHVGIYLSNREFIHTPGGSWVKINSFNPTAPNFSEGLLKSFVRAQRYIGSTKIPEVPGK